tara:strand:- start:9 stop:161 length:153 start_codon:yes stop_codon:yes gene_type:complete
VVAQIDIEINGWIDIGGVAKQCELPPEAAFFLTGKMGKIVAFASSVISMA